MIPTQEATQPKRPEITPSITLGIGTASPPLQLTQQEILNFILNNFDIKDSTRQLYKRTLSNTSIAKRHFALSNLLEVLDTNHERINRRFEKGAIQLSTNALNKAISAAQISPKDIDYLAVTTCTGYLCPGLAPQLIETCHLKHDLHFADLVGMGCGAALPALEQAFNFTKANPGSVAAVVATEICSAAMFSNDDVDIVVSNSIFADGSGAMILGKGTPQFKSFASLVVPEWRDTLRFKTEGGHLKNVLGKNVPAQAGQAIKKLAHRLLADNGLTATNVAHWVIHPGGEKILLEIEKSMGLTRSHTQASWNILKNFGNMSSASVLFVLEEEMKLNPPQTGEWGFLCSFGAGFSVHAALVQF